MPALKPTDFSGEIVFLGVVRPGTGLAAQPMDALRLTFEGPMGEAHGGRTRESCSRVLGQHPRGTEIANTRQLSILSQEELDEPAETAAASVDLLKAFGIEAEPSGASAALFESSTRVSAMLDELKAGPGGDAGFRGGARCPLGRNRSGAAPLH